MATLWASPTCGMTHSEHAAAWRSWRDDCLDPEMGCGYAQRDVDQCRRGHPDDGVTQCGACGHGHDGPVLAWWPPEPLTAPARPVVRPGVCDHEAPGEPACERAARPYLCGWRCERHAPAAQRRRE